jgi:hypothetical protein
LEGEIGLLEKKDEELVGAGAGSSTGIADEDRIVCNVYGVYGIRGNHGSK